ncbi:MAG: sigma-70 family RNA polymerase sigma factor [Luteimonas sp.]|nr:sigma-70 family RNA polymerase sigma factor [Luteimonas sp.]
MGATETAAPLACAKLETTSAGHGAGTGIDGMSEESRQAPVTQLLARARDGDPRALDAAFAAVYQELKGAARSQLRRNRSAFDTTVLVHEAYLKLTGGGRLAPSDRNHLLALSARAMRQVLVDHARSAHALKRGAGRGDVTLTARLGSEERAVVEVLQLDELLGALHRADPRAAQIVELRYFGGYEEEEIADMLGISYRTVRRDWRKARAFLLAELGE